MEEEKKDEIAKIGDKIGNKIGKLISDATGQNDGNKFVHMASEGDNEAQDIQLAQN